MENKNHIGTKLFKIRNERGETQEHVAECVGITYVSLSRYEHGQRMPKMDILARLAEHYGVTVDELIGRDEAETKKEPATVGGLSDSVKRLFDEVQSAGLTDAEVDYLRAQIEGIKALRKP